MKILLSLLVVIITAFGVSFQVTNHRIAKIEADNARLGANSTISNLTALSSPDDADVIAIVDNGVSPATTKKITWGNATSSLQTWNDGRYANIAGGTGIVTLGTIAAGTWNGTAIGVGYGGTGTTSPAQYRVLFGNAGSGITIATSTGISGQFLTSCGANCFPQWQTAAIDVTANYVWTGSHTFSGAVTHSATITLAGITLVATTTSSTNFIGKNFGGDGSDGALTCTSGTTTINLAGAAVIEKNYTSISITGTCSVAFSSHNTTGTIVVFKSQGDVTMTSSNNSVYLVGLGSDGGAGGASGGAGGTKGASGGGGSSMTTAGGIGVAGDNNSQNGGSAGSAFGKWLYSQTAMTGGGGASASGAAGAASVSPALDIIYAPTYLKRFVMPGSGGGGAQSGATSAGSNGGAGGGAFYMEVGGNLNITSTINASGTSTPPADSSGGCGGNGGGGSIQILYNYLTANSGTYNVSGGPAAGTCTHAAAGGAAGYSSVVKNIAF